MEFVYGKRCDNNARRNGVDPCATFTPMHRLCHDTLFIAALCQLVRMERIPDFFRLEHLQGEQFLCRCFGEQCVLFCGKLGHPETGLTGNRHADTALCNMCPHLFQQHCRTIKVYTQNGFHGCLAG